MIAGSLSLLVAIFAWASVAQAQPNLWVDRDSHGGSCSDSSARDAVTAATPLCTLAAAANMVQPGDAVLVRGGEYTEIHTCRLCNDNAVLQLTTSGSAEAWIKFVAEPGETVAITGQGGAQHGIQIAETYDGSVRPRFISVEGFQVRDVPGNCVAVNTADVVLRGLDLSGCGRGALELHSTARVTVESSRIHDNLMTGWTSAIDLYECLDGNVVRGNYIWANTDEDPRDSEGHGITMDYCQEAGGALIENNIIWANEGWCVAIFVSDGATIRNNTCWKNGTRGNETGELSLLGSHHSVHNNIAVPRDGAVALTLRLQNSVWSSDFSTVSANHNILWAPTHTEVVHFGENYWRTVAQYKAENTYGWGADSLQADPMLVDPDNQDFSLANGSPAIDSGDPSHAAESSVTEQARPCDGDGDGSAIVDRGAYETECPGQPGDPGGPGGPENPGDTGNPGGADGSGGGCSVGPTHSGDLVWFGLLAVILLRRRHRFRI
jgi:hypothetical protein